MLRNVLFACLSALALQGRGQDIIEVSLLDIRPMGEDYAPTFLDSGFVMVSVRESERLLDVKDARTNKPLSDLYWVPFKGGKTGPPELFSQALTTTVNEGPASFTQKGTEICFTRNLSIPRSAARSGKVVSELGLFFARRTGTTWSDPEPFAFNSQKFSIVHPSYSATGDTLFFASDMPGGYGGMDLYLSVRSGTGWSTPQNLGPSVNTAASEVYPRAQHRNELRFASNRPGAQGGLDILVSHATPSGWAAPEFLPSPINGPTNDLLMEPIGDGQHELLSSDRTGSDRIHLVKRTVGRFRECKAQERNNYCYSVRTKKPAITTTLPLDHVWDMGDGTLIKGLLAEHCYDQPGTYTIASSLVDRKSGKVFHTLRSHELEVKDAIQAFTAAPDTIRTGRGMLLDARLSNVPHLVPDEYHWDLGDGSRKSGARVQHTYRVPGTYTVRLDIIGKPGADGQIPNRCNTKTITVIDRYREHEDATVVAVYQDALGNTHSFEYQDLPFDDLSMSGAELADSKLSVQLFSSRERVSLDDPRFAQIRKYYAVMEQFDPTRGEYVYSVGQTDDLEEVYRIYQKVRELQFLSAEVFTMKEEGIMDLSDLAMARTTDLDRKKLRLVDIHFEYKSATLSDEAKETLEMIADLLHTHPELDLIIEAHTDGIGSRAYNMDLSQQRAMSVVDQLVNTGARRDRLTAIGHGRNHPIGDNRTEEGRRLNRRVEFRMVVRSDDQLSISKK